MKLKGVYNVRKIFFIVSLSVIFIIGGIVMANKFVSSKNNLKNINIDDIISDESKGFIPDDGYVSTEKTAVEIAEAVWVSIYGNEIYKNRPFEVALDMEKQCWYVKGTLPPNTLGGVPEIIISKSTGEILYVSHSK